MEWFGHVRHVASLFLDRHGLLAAFLLIFVEEAGVPSPLPGDVLMLLAGVRAHQGAMALWQVILLLEAATVPGATLLYAVSRWAGHGLVVRYGRLLHLTPERLAGAEGWFRRRGFWAIVLGRLAPGARILTAVAAGVFEVPFRVFLPATAVGALLYITLYTGLGYLLGPRVLRVVERVHLPIELLFSVGGLLFLGFWLIRARLAIPAALRAAPRPAHRRLAAGAAAGAAAGLAGLWLLHIAGEVVGLFAFRGVGTPAEQAARRLTFALSLDARPTALLVFGISLLALGTVCGALYGLAVEPHLSLPDWARGLLFAFVPLAITLLVIVPLQTPSGPPPTAFVSPMMYLAAGYTLRMVAYGLVLGVCYPVFLVRLPARGALAVRRRVPQAAAPGPPAEARAEATTSPG
jgi:membrane protein DedA with SNARE-associated domain